MSNTVNQRMHIVVAGFRCLAVLVISGTVLCGCEGCRTPVPEVDLTPPNVVLFISGPGLSKMVTSGGSPESVSLDKNVEYTLTAFAVDGDGGVRQVGIGGGMTTQCTDEKRGIGSATFADYSAVEPTAPTDLQTGQMAPTVRFVQMTLNKGGRSFGCGSGFTFEGAAGSFIAWAENYKGTTADTPCLTVSFR